MHPKRKTIGIRVPDFPIAQALLTELKEPMLSSTLQLPDDEFPMMDPYEIRDVLEAQVDLIIDGGYCAAPNQRQWSAYWKTIPQVLRSGKGAHTVFQE